MRKRGNLGVILCLLLAGASLFMASGPLRGWLVLAACGSAGVLLLMSRETLDRLQNTLIGLYVLLTGVSVGLPKVWVPTPSWVHVVSEASFWGSLALMVCAAWVARTRLGARHPTTR
jgi:hypothetical protein